MRQDFLLHYFKIFSKFLARDLYVSLRPLEAYKKIEGIDDENAVYRVGGRQEFLLYSFVLNFKLIVGSHASNEEIKASLDSFSDLIDVYLEINEDSGSMHNALSLNVAKVNTEHINKIIDTKNIEIYTRLFRAMSILNNHMECTKSQLSQLVKDQDKAKKNVDKLKIVLTQSTIEFSNALAHMLSVLLVNKDDNDNINKAMTHIHRATLDNYKTVIKHLELTPELKKDLINLRVREFISMGKSIKSVDKDKILDDYESLCTVLLSSFPENSVKINRVKKKLR